MNPSLSLLPLYLEMLYRNDQGVETVQSSGTGFYYSTDAQRVHLITARHNLAGRAWRTNEVMYKSHPVEPNIVRVFERSKSDNSLTAPRDIMLYEEDSSGNHIPLWLEHPTYGREMDVVALPVDTPHNPYWQGPPTEPHIEVTDEVFIVGYPYGLRSQNLALWTRGTVASDPDIAYDGVPVFLIDSRTRSGQSGSPVLLYHPKGAWRHTEDNAIGFVMGIRALLGVYTGRINPHSIRSDEERNELKLGTDLGIVWRANNLDSICQSGVRNTLPPLGPLPEWPRSGEAGS